MTMSVMRTKVKMMTRRSNLKKKMKKKMIMIMTKKKNLRKKLPKNPSLNFKLKTKPKGYALILKSKPPRKKKAS